MVDCLDRCLESVQNDIPDANVHASFEYVAQDLAREAKEPGADRTNARDVQGGTEGKGLEGLPGIPLCDP